MTQGGFPTTEGFVKHTEVYSHGAELLLNLSPLDKRIYTRTDRDIFIYLPVHVCMCVFIACVSVDVCIIKHFASERSPLTRVSVGSGCDKDSCV